MRLGAVILALIVSLLPWQPDLGGLARYLAVSAGPQPQLNRPPATRPAAIPVAIGNSDPQLKAAAVYALDLSSGKVLYTRGATATRPIASITKLVTAMVIVKDHDLNEIVKVPPLPSYSPDDERLGLTPGQSFRLGELLKAALIASDNDAADTLAIYDAGSIPTFSAKMNDLVARWGISGAHFVSASGLVDQDNYASAQSLARLAKIALTNSAITSLVASPSAQISDLNGQSYDLKATNQLLADSRFGGIKTGYTMAAGQSLLGLVNFSGHRVITVVLDSPDRFGETKTLADFIERNYQWQ